MNKQTEELYVRVMKRRAKRLNLTLEEVMRPNGFADCSYMLAAQAEADKRGVTAEQVLQEDLEKLKAYDFADYESL